MNRSVIKPINTLLSGSDFYRKIINKYQMGKIKALRFPIIIFYKSKEYLFHKKIDMSILLQMYFYNQNILFPLIVKTIPIMKEMLSQLDTGKNTLQLVLKPKNIQNVSNVKKFFTSNAAFNQQTTHIIHSNNIVINPQILYYRNEIKILNSQAFRTRINCPKYRIPEINKPFFKEPNQITVYGLFIKKYYDSLRHSSSSLVHRIHAYRKTYSGNQFILPLILLQDILFFNSATLGMSKLFYKHLNQVIVNEPLIKKYYGSFGHSSSSSVNKTDAYKTGYYGNKSKLSATLSHDILFFNSATLGMSKLFYKYLNQVTVNEPLIKNDHDSFKHISSNSAQRTAQRTYAYKAEGGIMRFQDSGYLEQEIEQIKKIVLQTKESISEKPKPSLGEAEIKRYLDINRISDQVYQNIERTIRMERERRGI